MEKKLAAVNKKLAAVNKKLAAVSKKLAAVSKKLDTVMAIVKSKKGRVGGEEQAFFLTRRILSSECKTCTEELKKTDAADLLTPSPRDPSPPSERRKRRRAASGGGGGASGASGRVCTTRPKKKR